MCRRFQDHLGIVEERFISLWQLSNWYVYKANMGILLKMQVIHILIENRSRSGDHRLTKTNNEYPSDSGTVKY